MYQGCVTLLSRERAWAVCLVKFDGPLDNPDGQSSDMAAYLSGWRRVDSLFRSQLVFRLQD